MDSFTTRFTILLLSLYASTLFADEQHGLRGGIAVTNAPNADTTTPFNVSEGSFDLVEDFPVVYPPSFSNRTTTAQQQQHRHLATASGTRTLLFIRVIANNVAPTVSAAELRQAAFGASGSLAYQLRVCSEGRLNVVQSPHGVKDLRINANPRDVRAMITESQRAAGQLGLGNIKSAANHIAWVFPEQGSAYVAEAEIIGSYSWFNNNLAKSHSVLVHEVRRRVTHGSLCVQLSRTVDFFCEPFRWATTLAWIMLESEVMNMVTTAVRRNDQIGWVVVPVPSQCCLLSQA